MKHKHLSTLIGLSSFALLCAICWHHGLYLHAAHFPALEQHPVTQAGMAMELIAWLATHPGATPASGNATALAGNSFAIRSFDQNKSAWMLELWGVNQAAGNISVKSPRLHDNVVGIQATVVPAQANTIYPYSAPQRLYTQDVLSVTQSAADGAGDIEMGAAVILYDDLPGADAKFIGPDDLAKRMIEMMVVTNNLTPLTTGQYTGQQAINALQDQWKADNDYALLGYQVSALCNCVRWQGADTGNYGVGGPGNSLSRFETADWFVRMSKQFARPLIPVFNSNNKSGILIDCQQDENAAAVTVTSYFARLSAR